VTWCDFYTVHDDWIYLQESSVFEHDVQNCGIYDKDNNKDIICGRRF
jgi:hypothetical protein